MTEETRNVVLALAAVAGAAWAITQLANFIAGKIRRLHATISYARFTPPPTMEAYASFIETLRGPQGSLEKYSIGKEAFNPENADVLTFARNISDAAWKLPRTIDTFKYRYSITVFLKNTGSQVIRKVRVVIPYFVEASVTNGAVVTTSQASPIIVDELHPNESVTVFTITADFVYESTIRDSVVITHDAGLARRSFVLTKTVPAWYLWEPIRTLRLSLSVLPYAILGIAGSVLVVEIIQRAVRYFGGSPQP